MKKDIKKNNERAIVGHFFYWTNQSLTLINSFHFLFQSLFYFLFSFFSSSISRPITLYSFDIWPADEGKGECKKIKSCA